MSKLKLVVYAGMALFLVALMLMGCWRSGGVPGAGASADRVNITPDVSISHLPKLYEPFTVTGKFRAAEKDEEDAEVWIAVKGAVYLDGEDRWHGPLRKGEEKVLSARFAMVTEGNHEVRAVAAKQKRGGPEGTVIVLYISSKESQMGWKDTGGEGSSIPMDYPPFLVRGATLVADTTLALNTSPASRVEVLQGPEDVARLQEEGLSPKELRYAWRTIAIVDFSKSLLITFFDELRPGPGCLPFLEGPDLVMQEDVFKGGYRTFCLPGSSSKLTRSVSSVEIVEVGRLVHWIPQSGPVSERPLQKRPLDGITTLEFTINDGDLVRYTVDIRSVGVETK